MEEVSRILFQKENLCYLPIRDRRNIVTLHVLPFLDDSIYFTSFINQSWQNPHLLDRQIFHFQFFLSNSFHLPLVTKDTQSPHCNLIYSFFFFEKKMYFLTIIDCMDLATQWVWKLKKYYGVGLQDFLFDRCVDQLL